MEDMRSQMEEKLRTTAKIMVLKQREKKLPITEGYHRKLKADLQRREEDVSFLQHHLKRRQLWNRANWQDTTPETAIRERPEPPGRALTRTGNIQKGEQQGNEEKLELEAMMKLPGGRHEGRHPSPQTGKRAASGSLLQLLLWVLTTSFRSLQTFGSETKPCCLSSGAGLFIHKNEPPPTLHPPFISPPFLYLL